jgi:hypothetical protein
MDKFQRSPPVNNSINYLVGAIFTGDCLLSRREVYIKEGDPVSLDLCEVARLVSNRVSERLPVRLRAFYLKLDLG